MRVIDGQEIIDKLAAAIITANTKLPPDVLQAIRAAIEIETLPRAKNILQIILENAHIAETEKIALCQDTGMVVIDVEIGQDVNISGGNLEDILNEGVRRGYKAGYLRNSVVNDPILRINTLDNTPAIIHYKIVSGDKVKITLFPKGAGSENVGQLSMLNPLDGLEGVKAFVLKTVREAGANPCPPIIVGVGIGGNMEKATLLAKRALLRPLDIRSKLPYLAEFELDLLNEINNLGIGPQGLGGKTTALGVNIEAFATHIASLPVAVNIGCHSTRRMVVSF